MDESTITASEIRAAADSCKSKRVREVLDALADTIDRPPDVRPNEFPLISLDEQWSKDEQ